MIEKLPNNLIFIRHGENIVDSSIQNIDLPLSSSGVEQALWAAEILKTEHIDKILSSPTRRTLETLSLIKKNINPETDIRLLERGWGNSNSGNEKEEEVHERISTLINEIKEKYSNKNVLVVTHGGLIKTIENIIEGKNLFDHKIENCSITIYSKIDDETNEDNGYFRYKKTSKPYDSEVKKEILKKGISVYFVRHGESTSNRDGVLAGSMDFPLTSNGINQAEKIASEIAQLGIEFKHIFSSPLSRSLDTAKIIAQKCSIPDNRVIILNELTGCGGGKLEGKPYSEWYSTPTSELVVKHGAESYDQQKYRIKKAISKILNSVEYKDNVLIVSHSSVFQVFQAINNNINDETETFNQKKPSPGSYLITKL